MDELLHFLRTPFGGATAGDYLAFAAIVVGALLLKKGFSRLLARIFSKLAIRSSGGGHGALFRSLIRKPVEWLFAVILFFRAFNFIEEPLNRITLLHWHRASGTSALRLADVIDHLFALFGIVFTTLLLSRLADFFYRAQADHAAHREGFRERAQLLPLLKDVVKIVLWTIGFFWILGVVFHVNIPALVTGLGIGGVAIALAAKESIENLLASFTILADKPFTVEDTVRLGTLEGKVERIGFRSTRLRSADGSLFIVPNKKLIDESLENLSGRDRRKIRLLIPVVRTMPEDALQSLLRRLAEAIMQEAQVQGTPSVSVESFGETSAQLLIVYHLPDALPESEIQAARSVVNERVYRALNVAL